MPKYESQDYGGDVGETYTIYERTEEKNRGTWYVVIAFPHSNRNIVYQGQSWSREMAHANCIQNIEMGEFDVFNDPAIKVGEDVPF